MNAITVAPVGHNLPPVFDLYKECIDDLLLEAQNFLDGEPIANQEQADAVGQLLDRLRKAKKDADEARKDEKRPHDEAAKAVQAKWAPIIEKADLAASTCKQALSPYLQAQEEAQRRAVEAAQEEARQKAEAARQAASQADPTDLAGQTTARSLHMLADEARKAASKLDKQKPKAAGGERSVTLRTVWRAELTDPLAFGKWLWEHRHGDYLEWLTGWAQSESRHGPRGIPGITVHEERTAV